MKILFIGSVEIGYKCIKQIIKDGWDIAAIFTLDKRYASSTSGYIDFTQLARENRIPIYKVKNFNANINIRKIRKISPDLIIICGCQSLICKEILKVPRLGTIGFHSSLLPKYRGRAPVNWAIIRGEEKTGITMFYCVPKADAGDIIARRSFPILINDTCKTIYEKTGKMACGLLHAYLPKIDSEKIGRRKNTSAKYRVWPKRRPKDGRINWNNSPLSIHNWIRALTKPYPGAFSYLGKEKYFIFGSNLYRGKIGVNGLRGSVIKIKNHKEKRSYLIKTRGGALWVHNIASGNKESVGMIKLGVKFI